MSQPCTHDYANRYPDGSLVCEGCGQVIEAPSFPEDNE